MGNNTVVKGTSYSSVQPQRRRHVGCFPSVCCQEKRKVAHNSCFFVGQLRFTIRIYMKIGAVACDFTKFYGSPYSAEII